MTFEYPFDCQVGLTTREEIVDASFGVTQLCHGFGSNGDSEKTTENIARWSAAVQACGRFAATGCQDCRTTEFLETIKSEVSASEG